VYSTAPATCHYRVQLPTFFSPWHLMVWRAVAVRIESWWAFAEGLSLCVFLARHFFALHRNLFLNRDCIIAFSGMWISWVWSFLSKVLSHCLFIRKPFGNGSLHCRLVWEWSLLKNIRPSFLSGLGNMIEASIQLVSDVPFSQCLFGTVFIFWGRTWISWMSAVL